MGCCDNKHTMQASEELIREKLAHMKISSFTYLEMKQQLETLVIANKLPKKSVESNILSSENPIFTDISILEKNIFEFILNHYPTTMNIYECLFYIYPFLKTSHKIEENNRFIFEVFNGSCKKLTLSSFEKLLSDYIQLITFKLNFFFETNLKGTETEHKEDLAVNNVNIFNYQNIRLVVRKLMAKLESITQKDEEITFESFNKNFSETDISLVSELRDLFFATF